MTETTRKSWTVVQESPTSWVANYSHPWALPARSRAAQLDNRRFPTQQAALDAIKEVGWK
jgi:hypothetical protein